MPASRRLLISIFLITTLLIIGIASFALTTLVPMRGLRFDYYPHWVAGQALWSGQTPYAPEITRQIQLAMFGETLPPDADQQNVAYPAYSAVLLWPMTRLPAPVSIAVWMALQLVTVIWTPIIWLAILHWKPTPFSLFTLILGLTFAFHYPIDTFILGQFSGTVLLGISLGCWLLAQKRDILAGIIMALLATTPPTVGGILALAILGGYALTGRWSSLLIFILTLGILTGISILKIGWWLPDWLDVIQRYAAYATPTWPPHFLPLAIMQPIFVGLLVLFGLWMLLRFIRLPDNKRGVDFALATIFLALLLLPQTGYYYLVLLIPALVACLERGRTLSSRKSQLVRVVCAFIIICPWLYFALPGAVPDAHTLILPFQVAILWSALNAHGWWVHG